MYQIKYNGQVIYDDTMVTQDSAIVSPKLSLAENTAGSLVFTIPTTNKFYNTIASIGGHIEVYRNDEWLWEGRILGESKDFWNQRTITCEGALAYLNDTIQPHHDYGEPTSVRDYIDSLLTVHNRQKANEPDKQINVGVVTVDDPTFAADYRTNYESTLTYISGLTDKLGGHIRIRRVTSGNTSQLLFDYLNDYINNGDQQEIRFGQNLLEDFTREWDNADFATVLIPLGAKLASEEEDESSDFEDYLTVETASRGDGSIYVKNAEALANYGRIEKQIRFDDVEDPDVLYDLAETYLSQIQFQSLIIELSAVDLSLLDVNYRDFRLLDNVLVISKPHGMNARYPITKITIPLDAPENATYTLGNKQKQSLSAMSTAVSEELRKEIDSIVMPSESVILAQAQANAARIMDMATTGYITIVPSAPDQQGNTHAQELIISPTADYTQADYYWRWNINGLGFTDDGGQTYLSAMTMDGSIVADRIATGTLKVGEGVIVEGPAWSNKPMLKVYTDSNSPPTPHVDIYNAKLEISNNKNNIVIDASQGILIQKKSGSSTSNVFYVDTNGNLVFTGSLSGANGTFSGELDAASGTFQGTMNAGSININNAFQVDSSGNVTMSGSFNEIVSPKISTIRPDENNATMYLAIASDGLKLYSGLSGVTSPSLVVGAESSTWTYPYIQLGIGSGSSSGGKIIKMTNGLWVGTNQSGGTSPSGGTGLWIDFTDGKLYKYNNGTASEIGSGGGSTATAVFG